MVDGNPTTRSPIPDEIMQGKREDIESGKVFNDTRTAVPPASAPVSEDPPTVPPSVPTPPPVGDADVAEEAKKINPIMIEDLLMFGSIKHEMLVGNMRFVVRTLNNEEKEAAFAAVSSLPTQSFIHYATLRDALMARALDKVNGMPLETSYRKIEGDKDDYSNLEKRLLVIKRMHTPLLNKLYELYNILEAKAEEAVVNIDFEEVKNS